NQWRQFIQMGGFRSTFGGAAMGLLVERKGVCARIVKCQTSNVECQIGLVKRPNDPLTQLGQWVIGSFDNRNLTFDMGHLTFDVLGDDTPQHLYLLINRRITAAVAVWGMPSISM